MARQDTINERMNDLSSSQGLTNQVEKSIESSADIQPQEMDVIAPSATDKVILEDQEVKVAGIIPKKVKKKISETLEVDEKNAKLYNERYQTKQSDKDYVIQPYGVESADDVEQLLETAKTKPTSGKPAYMKGVKGKKVAEKDQPVINLNNINSPDSLKQFIGVVGDAYKVTKERVSSKAIIEDLTRPRFYVYGKDGTTKAFDTEDLANKYVSKQKVPDDFSVEGRRPYTKKYLDKILDPKNPTLADPKYVGDMLVTQLDLTQQTEKLAQQIKKLKDADQRVPDELLVEFDQMFALTGEVHKAISNRTADIGRSLQIFGQLRSPSGTETMFQEYFTKTGGRNISIKTALRFTELQHTSDKARMATNLFTLRNSPRIVKDVLYANWINGLLSSPITHLKNIIGNFTFGAMRSPELFMASLFSKGFKGAGKVGLKWGDDTFVETQEAFVYAKGYFGSMGDGLRLAVKGRDMNARHKGGTKLDAYEGGDAFDVNFSGANFNAFGKEVKAGDFMSKALRVYGKVATLPGEILLREDEFFKAIGFKGEYERLVFTEHSKALKEGLDKGEDFATAKKRADELAADLYDNPNPDLVKQAVDMSEELTFTKNLEGNMAKFQRVVNYGSFSPILKAFFPFVRTPTNIAMKITERSPLAIAMPSVRQAIMKGGRARDEALGKIAFGSGVMGTLSYNLGFSGMITGAGPSNIDQLKTWKAKGWQPFSFVLNKEDISDDLIKRYRDFTPVTISGNKVYISYAGIQPIGAALAIAGTLGEYFQLQAKANSSSAMDETTSAQVVEAGVLAATELFKEFPMLQGAADLLDIVNAGGSFRGEQLFRFIEKAAQKGGEVVIGGSPVGLFNSLASTVERKIDPSPSSLLPTEGKVITDSLDHASHGFFTAWKKFTSRIPLYSETLPPRLDTITGRPVMYDVTDWYDNWNPLPKRDALTGTGARIMGELFPGRKTETDYNPAYEALVRFKVPVYQPPTVLDGFRLSAEQYNKWIKLATADGGLQEKILNAQDRAIDMESLSKGQALMRSAMSTAYQDALKILAEEDRDLRIHIEGRDMDELLNGSYSWY